MPEISSIDTSQLNDLASLISISNQLGTLVDQPQINTVDLEQLNELGILQNQLNELRNIESVIVEADNRKVELDKIIEENQGILNRFGVKTIKCPNCGETIVADDLESQGV